MKGIGAALLALALLSTCHLFLGPDPENSPRDIFDSIWGDFNKNYALFEVKGIDWDKIYEEYSPQISSDMDNYDLFKVCGEMLNALKDGHVHLSSPFGNSILLNDDYFDDRDWVDLKVVYDLLNVSHGYLSGKDYLPEGQMFLCGKFKSMPRFGYIFIKSFAGINISLDIIPDWAKEIDNIVQTLADTDALVLDLRNNTGGFGSNMDYIASRFIDTPRPYLKSTTKNGPGRNDFSTPLTWEIKPAGTRYIKNIVLLTNNNTSSAGEWFVQALRSQGHVIHIGTKTHGMFSPRVIRHLINGWEYTMSVQKVEDMEGNCLEGIGISPDKHVEYNFVSKKNKVTGETQTWDTQLEYALKLFQPDF
jgi:hypothetical protein